MQVFQDKESISVYCPYCARDILPSNIAEVENGEDDSYIYVHDEGVVHDPDYDYGPLD